MKINDIVYLPNDIDHDQPGTVVQVGTSDNMPAPDVNMVLVRWSRILVHWEYIEDLVVKR